MKNNLIIISLFLFSVNCASGDKFVQKKQLVAIHIAIEGIRDTKGNVMAAMYHTENNFDKNIFPASAVLRKVTGNTTSFTFNGKFAPEKYAIVVFHDENGNGIMDTSKMGLPLEGFGFSNNPSLQRGKPDWKQTAFEVNANKNIVIKMMYP